MAADKFKLPDLNLLLVSGSLFMVFIILRDDTVQAILKEAKKPFDKAKDLGAYLAEKYNASTLEFQKALGFDEGVKTSSAEIQNISDRVIVPYRQSIVKWSNKMSLLPEVVTAIIWHESKGRTESIGAALEFGLMQVTNAALKDVNERFRTDYVLTQLRNPEIGIEAGCRFLKIKLDEAGSVFEALRYYNCGTAGARNNSNCGHSYATTVFNHAVGLRNAKVFA